MLESVQVLSRALTLQAFALVVRAVKDGPGDAVKLRRIYIAKPWAGREYAILTGPHLPKQNKASQYQIVNQLQNTER